MRVYGGRMRLLLAVLAASTLIGGCACTEASLIGLPVEHASEASAETAAVARTPVGEGRIPGGWWVSPGSVGECTSPLAMGTTIPCSAMMNVCTESAEPTNVMMPHIYFCTSESPTWRDVCATRPAAEWPFYAIEPEDCAATDDVVVTP